MSDREAFYNVYKKVTGFTGTLEELFQDDMCATAKGRSIEVAYQCYQAALSNRKDAIESLKSQLAEAQGERSDLTFMVIKLIEERDEALKANHVYREALKVMVEGYGYSDYISEEEKQSDPKVIMANKALSTPSIEGLVVCKDEPIYQVWDIVHGYVEADEADKEEFDAENDKRIVYEKAGSK